MSLGRSVLGVRLHASLALLLGLCAYPRVRLIYETRAASHLDAVTIAVAYAMIVAMANFIGVLVALGLHMFDMAAVGAPPVVQVTVDVLGVTITMLVAQAILGESDDDGHEAERAAELVGAAAARLSPSGLGDVR